MGSLDFALRNKYPKEEASQGEGREYNKPTVFIGGLAGRAAKDPGNFNSWRTSVLTFEYTWS